MGRLRNLLLLVSPLLLPATGCYHVAPYPGEPFSPIAPVVYENPSFFAIADREQLWEQLVDVLDDNFRIEREERVRQVGELVTEGSIDTFPLTGATLFEPWHRDSVDRFGRLESTLQSIRRTAHVRVIPTGGGYLVEVRVDKELEDVARPENATSGLASLRHDQALDRRDPPASGVPATTGWISQGRDPLLEQAILAKLHARLAAVMGVASPPAF